MATPDDAGYIAGCATSLQAINGRSPRVHCITNAVAMNYSANMLLASGAIPSMSMALNEVADFVAGASSLCINIGTIDEQRRRAITIAIETARSHNKPWVLDPVLITASEARHHYAEALLEQHPAVVRGNAGEIALLAKTEYNAAQQLARTADCVVVQTGASDQITDGDRCITIANGHPMMTRITALGCASSALLAAFLAVEKDIFKAAIQTFLALGVAGEIAAESSPGPGSLQIHILDQLYRLDRMQLQQRSRIA
jgi:hydroxyethylthiazole kinase